ncbi:hypothetical protein PG990_013560 [Apiospora arundinis]
MEDHENNHEGSDAPIPYQLAMENLYTPSTQCTASCKRCRLESWFEALADLFNRDYWRRRWIIQEIAASKNVVILCGKERLSWGSLTRALHKCRLSPFWNGANRRAYRFFKTILELRSSYQDTGGPCLGRCICGEDGRFTRPSWAINWSSHPASSNFEWELDNSDNTQYSSCRPSIYTAADILRGPPNILLMRGITLASIIDVTSNISNTFSAEQNPDSPVLSSDTNATIRQSQAYYQTPQSVREALGWCLANRKCNEPGYPPNFEWSKERQLCRWFWACLHTCAREPRFYHRRALTEKKMAFRRWACTNVDFRIDGKHLPTLLRERGTSFYFVFHAGHQSRHVLYTVLSLVAFCGFYPLLFFVVKFVYIDVGNIILVWAFNLCAIAPIVYLTTLILSEQQSSDAYLRHTSLLYSPLETVARKERLAVCGTGMLAMVGDKARPTDAICQLDEFVTCVVLRKIEDEEGAAYELIGEASPVLSQSDSERRGRILGWADVECEDFDIK